MRIVKTYSPRLEAIGRQILLIVRGDPEGDMRRRLTEGCARCYVLATDRPTAARQWLFDLTEPPALDYRWHNRYPFYLRLPDRKHFLKYASRKAVLARIAQGNLGIEDRIGPWNGSFWAGLRAGGAIRKGSGTEWRIWERSHPELIADLSEMPLMHRLEPRAAKHGQRRLRRCYAALLPSEQATERSVLAGLFAGAVLRDADGEQWLELPAGGDAQAILLDWGIPFLLREPQKGRKVVLVSPLFAMLVAHLMPPRSAARIRSVRKAGGCPLLPAILWQMAMTAKGRRYMPFPDALPFGCSKATFFRRRWRRKDLNKVGWLELGIRITPKLRDLLVDWFQRRTCERNGHTYDPETYPLSPDIGIPPSSFPTPAS